MSSKAKKSPQKNYDQFFHGPIKFGPALHNAHLLNETQVHQK